MSGSPVSPPFDPITQFVNRSCALSSLSTGTKGANPSALKYPVCQRRASTACGLKLASQSPSTSDVFRDDESMYRKGTHSDRGISHDYQPLMSKHKQQELVRERCHNREAGRTRRSISKYLVRLSVPIVLVALR